MKLTKKEKETLILLGNKQHLVRLGKGSQLSSEEYKVLCTLTKKKMGI